MVIRFKKMQWGTVWCIAALVAYNSNSFCGGMTDNNLPSVQNKRTGCCGRISKIWYTWMLIKACDPKDVRKTDSLTRLVSTLIKKGADIHTTDRNGMPLLHSSLNIRSQMAVWKGDIGENQAFEKRLFHSLYNRSGILSDLLLQAGADVNKAESLTKNTPLHVALENVLPVPRIKILLEYGSHVNQVNVFGATPLQHFFDCNEGIEEDNNDEVYYIVKELLDHGANPYIKNNNGSCAFTLLQHRGTERLKALITQYAQETPKRSQR